MSEPKPDFSKIGKSNVTKAKVHERRIANLLTEWTKRPFRRRRVEGRDASTVERESTSDIIPVGEDIIFTIEAKSGKGFSLDGLLASPSTNIFSEWMHQVFYDAQIVTSVTGRDYYPLIFFKPHKNFDWVAFPNKLLLGVLNPTKPLNGFVTRVYDHHDPISMNVVRTKKKENYRMVPIQLEDMFITRWKEFSKHIDPDNIFRKI